MSNIIVTDSSIRIIELEVPVREVADFFRSVPDQERSFVMTKAIEVGTFCLERGRTAQDTEFVKRQIADLLSTVEKEVEGIPTKTENALISKLGTQDGQALAPIRQLLERVSSETTTKVNEVRTLLSQDLDPSKSTSTIGAALQKVRELLDPKHSDSIHATIRSAVETVTGPSGELAATVKGKVEEALKPLREEISNLVISVKGQEMVDEALQQTTQKGAPYEEEVALTIQPWAKAVGAHIDHVGPDNKPGDFVIELTNASVAQLPVRIVVEARDDQQKMGNQRISQDLARKLAERNADAGIYVSKTIDGLAKEVGDWGEGTCEKGPWVACTHEHLLTAARFLVIQMQLKKMREAAPDIDANAIQAQVATMRTSLKRVKTINTKVTNLGDTANDISKEANELRTEITASLANIEDSLRTARKPVAAIASPVSVVAATISNN